MSEKNGWSKIIRISDTGEKELTLSFITQYKNARIPIEKGCNNFCIYELSTFYCKCPYSKKKYWKFLTSFIVRVELVKKVSEDDLQLCRLFEFAKFTLKRGWTRLIYSVLYAKLSTCWPIQHFPSWTRYILDLEIYTPHSSRPTAKLH